MSANTLELISFKVCPYVQRSVIALNLKHVDYQLTYVNPHEPPEWFKNVSPLGKVPVLLVNSRPVFESAVILEYLDEVYAPRLHPADPLEKAIHRAWVEFCSDLLGRLFRLQTSKEEAAFQEARDSLQQGLQRLESVVATDGPFFAGSEFQLVDCVYAPLFMRLALLQQHYGVAFTYNARIQAWRDALLALPAVQNSVAEDFEPAFLNFLAGFNGFLQTYKKL